jgi:hypothetical protein
VTQPDGDAPAPTASGASAEPDEPAAPAMQADSALIVEVVRGSGAPSGDKTAVTQHERR